MAELKIIGMDEVAVEEIEWLWYPYIPFGKLTIIHGDPGEGKTTLILQLAALLSRGDKLPCDDTEREPISIIYQTAEDGLGDTIKPRLRYIKQHHKIRYTNLLTSCKLTAYLADINEQAEDMFFRLVKQLAEKEGITEQLKAENQMLWVARMNNIRNRATEIVNAELIYS